MKKRIITMIIALLAIITISFSAYAEETSDIDVKISTKDEFDISKFCDADDNGKISASDARYILCASAKLESCTEHALKYGDANKDGKITAIDARTILRVAAKLEDINCLAIGHDYSFEKGSVIKETCISDGYTEYKCSACGAIEKRDVIKTGGHEYKIISREFYSQTYTYSNIYKTSKQCKYCKYILYTYDINDVSNIQVKVNPLMSKEALSIIKKFNLSENYYIFEGYDSTNSKVVVYGVSKGVDNDGYYYNVKGEKQGNHDYCGNPLGVGEGMCKGLCNITWSQFLTILMRKKSRHF